MIKLIITSGKGEYDATHLTQSITWSGDYQQCSRTLEFGILSSYTDRNVPAVPCDLGSRVTFIQDKRVLFDGFIFERQKDTESNVINIVCYDRGIYLKRNEAAYKFTGVTPEAITRMICKDFGIDAGSIAVTGINISRNFIGVSLYKIIQTAYTLAAEQTGKKYMVRFSGSKLTVVEKTVTDETLVIEGGKNLMSASTSESISSMINQVAIYNSEDVRIGTQSDSEAIKLYGLMQSYLKQVDGEDVKAKAKHILAENGISQKIVINNLGNIANIAGGTVVVREPYTGLYGLFFIDADVHTWKLSQYYNKLTVNFKNMMDEQEAGSLPNKSGSKTADTWSYINKPGGGNNGG